jgi:Leucine-rich repeat (LRR) protein
MLNISHNIISNLSGLEQCTSLSTLICSQNSLSGSESISALSDCKKLSTADLQDNDLDSDAVSLFVLYQLKI